MDVLFWRVLEGIIVLALGTIGMLHLRATAERHQIQERLKHLPTRKQVTDEIADTRHSLRNEMHALNAEMETLIAKYHPIRRR